MNYIFIDTNIFIHFRDFEEIDWPIITGKQGITTLVIAPIVIDELDKHKYSSNKKIGNRVKKLLPRLESILENNSSCRYLLKYISSRPIDDTFSINKLNRKEQDDNLLASIIEFRDSIPSNNDTIVYVTNDVGPRLKARTLDISTIKLPDEYQLPIELDETEKENRILQKELADLKNRVSIIQLLFHPNFNLLVVEPIPEIMSKKDFIEREMADIKDEYAPIIYHEPTNERSEHTLSNFINHSFFALSKEQVNEYNEKLLKFYASYEKHFVSAYDNCLFLHNSLKIQLVLQNTGTLPAADIDIHLHFPDGFEIVEQNDLPKIKPKPEPPYKPKNRYDFPNTIISIPSFHRKSGTTDSLYDPNRPTIKKTNSYDVNYSLQRLKHHQSIELNPLYLKYQDISIQGKGFAIDYKIIVANLPNPVVGRLHVKFQKPDN